MRILQLAPRFVFPEDDGGKIGIANILKQFNAQGVDVTFVCFNKKKYEKKYIEEAKKYCRLILIEHSTENTFLRILRSFILNRSIYLDKHISEKVKKQIDAVVADNNFDIVHADHAAMVPLALYIKNKYKIPVGHRLHNIEWKIWDRYSDNLSKLNPKYWYVKQQSKVLRRKEIEFYDQVDVNFAITEIDKNYAKKSSPNANICIASAGVNPDEWKPINKDRNPNQMIIATILSWIHNINALKWFINSVFLEVQKSNPKAILNIIGKNPPDWLIRSKHPNLNILGYVEKVQPHLDQASIYIAPLFVGSGIRIKILEAMAMGLPVLATSVSAEGINAREEHGLYICNDAESYINTIIKLMNEPEITKQKGKKAREYVTENYSWEINVKIMLDEYKKLI